MTARVTRSLHTFLHGTPLVRLRAGRVLVLATAVAAVAVASAAYHAMVLQPLSAPAAEELVRVTQANPATGQLGDRVSPPNYRDLARALPADASAVGYTVFSAITRIEGRTVPAVTAAVTGDLTGIVGDVAAGERTIVWESTAPPSQVVLTHGFHQRVLGGADVLGSTIEIGGEAYEVIAVLPRGASLPGEPQAELIVAQTLPPEYWSLRDKRMLDVILRMPGGDGHRIPTASFGDHAANAGWRLDAESLTDALARPVRPYLMLAVLGAAVLALGALINTAMVLVSTLQTRRHQLATMSAVGASPVDLHTEMVGGVLRLALTAIAVGLVLAQLLWVVVAGATATLGLSFDAGGLMAHLGTPFALGMSAGVLTLTAILAVVLAMQIRGMRQAAHQPAASLDAGERRALFALVGLQLVASIAVLALLFSAGGRLFDLARSDAGFDDEGLLAYHVALADADTEDGVRASQRIANIAAELERLPGVTDVSAASAAPFGPMENAFDLPVRVPGGLELGDRAPEVQLRAALPGFFDALGLPLVHGRDIAPRDRADTEPVIVISRRTAETYWGRSDVVGQVLAFPWGEPKRVIGVVEDLRESSLLEPFRPVMWVPLTQFEFSEATFLLRAPSAAPGPGVVNDAIASVEPDAAVMSSDSMRALFLRSAAKDLVLSATLLAFAALALVIVPEGVYAVMAVLGRAERRRAGIMRALGALDGRVLRKALMPVVAVAVVAGIAGAVLMVTGLRPSIAPLVDWQVGTIAQTGLAAAVVMALAVAAAWIALQRAVLVPIPRAISEE